MRSVIGPLDPRRDHETATRLPWTRDSPQRRTGPAYSGPFGNVRNGIGPGSTVREPELVIESRSDPLAALHYRFYFGTKVGDKWLCVVVKYGAEDAFVPTAYLTDKPKKGEQLWPSR